MIGAVDNIDLGNSSESAHKHPHKPISDSSWLAVLRLCLSLAAESAIWVRVVRTSFVGCNQYSLGGLTSMHFVRQRWEKTNTVS